MQKIAVIGAGNLGAAIVQGLLKSGKYSPSNLIATRNRLAKISHLADQGVQVTQDNLYAVEQADLIILAVKPYKIVELLHSIKDKLDPTRHTVVSVATGITVSQIVAAVGFTLPVFRAMPNTAIEIQESMTCICAAHATPEQIEELKGIFDLLGVALVINEELMEAATVLGACGIAYVFRFIRAMMQGGIEIGFNADMASIIAEQTVKGAAEMLLKGDQHPEAEIDKVTTPKGCTISGLNEMEHRGFSSSLIKGILTSYQKIEQ